MLNTLFTRSALAAIASVFLSSPIVAETDATTAQRIASLEARLTELEARLASTEQETKEVKVLATNSGSLATGGGSTLRNTLSYDILANSAWRNLRWTQAEQWEEIKNGISEERVVELLGSPPRSVKSLKPRVDLVYYYETSLRDTTNSIRGKISFKDGIVIASQRPNFEKLNTAAK